MRTILITLAALLLSAAGVAAQATATTLAWDYDGVTPAVVATYQQTVLVDGVAQPGTPACTGSTAVPIVTICTLTVPTTAGARTYTVTSALGGNQKTTVRTINPALGPVAPGNPRITVTVVVTL